MNIPWEQEISEGRWRIAILISPLIKRILRSNLRRPVDCKGGKDDSNGTAPPPFFLASFSPRLFPFDNKHNVSMLLGQYNRSIQTHKLIATYYWVLCRFCFFD